MTEFDIPAISCEHCVRAVTDAVRGVDPAAKVDVDVATHRVRIESSCAESTLRAALAEEGYEPV